MKEFKDNANINVELLPIRIKNGVFYINTNDYHFSAKYVLKLN